MNLEFSFEESPIVFEKKELTGEKKAIHERTLFRTQRYLVAEAELLKSIIEADQTRLFEDFGLAYLTPYCIQLLGLSDDVAAVFVRVARKTYEVPELKSAIESGKLTVSKAKTIASVINSQNQEIWIQKAEAFSKNKLEKAVAEQSPKPFKPEKSKFEGPNRVRYEFDLTEEESRLFKRAQDILCQKRGKSVSLSETQAELLQCFLDKHDPIRKAQRVSSRTRLPLDRSRDRSHDPSRDRPQDSCRNHIQNSRQELAQDPSRDKVFRAKGNHISATVIHTVNLRDHGKCQARLPEGGICSETKWIHFHHIIPKSKGGKDSAENLVTLCSAHHRLWHSRE